MTNSWTDIANADVVLVMGGNAAEAHPCGFKWVTEAKANHGAKLMVVDPRFTRTAAVADHYAPIRPGTDVAFLCGVMKYLLDNEKYHKDYVLNYTNAAYVVRDDYAFDEGLFSGYDADKRTYDRSSWEYVIGDDGFAQRDMTLANPRCVFQLLKEHVAQYTPELVSKVTGTPQDKFATVCELIGSTGTGERAMTIMYALGWTQHSSGSQNIRCAAMIQLLLGNIGVPGGGINALRGHSNVQGITDIGTLTANTPGYMAMPTDAEPTLESHLSKRTFTPLQPNQTSYWQNYRKFYVSLLKSMYGAKAGPENEFGYGWLPKVDTGYDAMKMFDVMHQGKTTGLICQGFNPLMSIPFKGKNAEALAKLKFLVSLDPIQTDTARFWENHGEFNDVDTAAIETEVFMLPITSFVEEEGTITNSSRVIQWKWKGADPYGASRTDVDVLADLFHRLRTAYAEAGGPGAEPLLAVDWSYADPAAPTPDELLREHNGKALRDVTDAEGKVIRKAGEQLASFGEMRDDGSTDGCQWIYTGVYGPKGNFAQRRDNADPSGLGVYGSWAFAWPANRRILYNRASADPSGKPWSEARAYVYWDAGEQKWTGADVPDFVVTNPPDKGSGPFIMNPEGVSRLWARTMMTDGPFPAHYEPFEAPVTNPVFPKVKGNPVARVFGNDWSVFGEAAEFPIVATTYRLTEHFHYWTKSVHINAVLQPESFIELSEQLAQEKGISPGQRVRIWSHRGEVKAVAMVTKRMTPLQVDGRTVHVIGVPLHFGFIGLTRKAAPVNSLTPPVGDANSQTPEFKAFLVDIAPDAGPVV